MKKSFTQPWARSIRAILFSLLTAGFVFSNAQTVTLTVLTQPCNYNGVVVATVSGMAGPYVFEWYNQASNKEDTVNTGTTDTLKNYPGGYLSVYVTNPASDFADNNISVSPFTYTVSVTQADCPVPSAETVNITGGTAPFVVQWYKGSISDVVATGQSVSLPAGSSYGIQITDAHGCVSGSSGQGDSSLYIYDTNAPVLNITTTDANCTNGTAVITSVTGAVGPNTYLWSNGSTASQLSNLVSGDYSVVLTDSRGCVGKGDVYVAQAVTINVNVVPTDATCIQNNGSAITFGSGGGTPPYTYLYSNGQQTQTATNLSAGSYNVQVTDVNGCFGQNYFNIQSTTPITATCASTASSCITPSGTANLDVAGGSPPYSIDWSTFPRQTGLSADNLSSGVYSFRISDASGCVQNGAVYVPTISGLSAYAYGSYANCPNNDGLAEVEVISGARPYTYSWSNGATTPAINNLASGGYACTVTDAMSCQVIKYAAVAENSSIALGVSTSPASCLFNADGSATVAVSGGVPPYTISWSGGQTGTTATSLPTGYSSVYATDSKGCSAFQQIFIGYNAQNNSCYCTITGTVYDDANGNCVRDPGEPGIQNIMISNNVTGYTFTDANGNYSMIVPSGSYNIQEITNNIYPLAPCQSNSNPVTAVASSGCTDTVNFANTINPLHDLHIMTLDLIRPKPGFSYTQRVVVENDGTVTENAAILGYASDGQLSVTGISGLSLTQANPGTYPNWYSVSSGFPLLSPAQAVSADINFNVPANIPLETTLNFYDTTAYIAPMSNWLNDYSPWDNLNHLQTIVVGSFDPNFIEVLPQGAGTPGYISGKDSILSYTIHFQNTGSAPAQKVVVKVQIDPNLNMKTLRPGYATAAYTTTMDTSGMVSFTFNNINLSDSSSNPVTSIGVVTYSVKIKNNSAPGTQFKANASIYFDYNAPVVTNSTLNTIEYNLGITEFKSTGNTISLYPNPARDAFSMKVVSSAPVSPDNGTLGLYTVDGKLVFEQPVALNSGANLISVSTEDIASGLYFVRITSNAGQQEAKISIIR